MDEPDINSIEGQYNIKNITPKTTIYVNNYKFLDESVFESLGYEIIEIDRENMDILDDVINEIEQLTNNKKLCRGVFSGTFYGIHDCDLLIVIKGTQPNQIYSFCQMNIEERNFSKSYNGPPDKYKYLYADIICSHSNVKYAGEKLLYVLFNIAKTFNINIELSSVEEAESFYEKYGFIKKFNMFLHVSTDDYVYIIDQRTAINGSIVYITENAMKMITIHEPGYNTLKMKFNNPSEQDKNELVEFYFNSPFLHLWTFKTPTSKFLFS